jgi:defect-in-organelle-trafficking protein DotC
MQPKKESVGAPALRKALLAVALAAAFGGAPTLAMAQQSDALNSLMNASAGRSTPPISPVREAILRPTAQALGTQTGMIEAANEILQVINDLGGTMDRSFRFGDLVMGQGVLPPVVVASHNSASLGESGKTMRVAGSVYKIEESARFFTGAPSWRDWLLMGLLSQADVPDVPDNPQLLPQDDKERAYWQDVIQKSYRQGREQALRIFEENLAGLERTYLGMRTFYELHGRGLVSLPRLATSQDVVNQTDPNTIIVGDTVFRITVPSSFNTNTGSWKPTVGSAPTPSIPAQSVNLANPAFKPYVPAPQPETPVQQGAPVATPGMTQTAPVTAPSPQLAPADTVWSGAQQYQSPNGDQVIRIRIGQNGGATDPASYPARPAPAAAPFRVAGTVATGVAFSADLPQMLPVRASAPTVVADAASSWASELAPTPFGLPVAQTAVPARGMATHSTAAEEAARARAEIYAKAYADEFQRAYLAAQNSRVAPAPKDVSPPPLRPAPVAAVKPAGPADLGHHHRQVAQHVVAPGETVYSLAARFGVSWQSILSSNGLQSPMEVQPGRRLLIAAVQG